MASSNREEMGIEELESLLGDLKAGLGDIEELRDMVLGQTGQHTSSHNVKKFAEQMEETRLEIEAVTLLLDKKRNAKGKPV
jgi:hypothetical protein